MRKKVDLPPLTDEQRSFFAELYETHRLLLYRTALRMTGDPAEAQDVVQECLVRLMKNFEKISSLECCKTAAYMVYTIRNICITRGERSKRRRTLSLDRDEIAERLADRCAAAPDSDEKLAVIALMQSLSEEDRLLLEGWYLEGFSAEQLADRLSCRPESIRMKLSRARKRAEKILREKEGTDDV